MTKSNAGWTVFMTFTTAMSIGFTLGRYLEYKQISKIWLESIDDLTQKTEAAIKMCEQRITYAQRDAAFCWESRRPTTRK